MISLPLLSIIVEHCRSKNKGLILLYLTTIVTMIDNIINRVCNGWYRFPYCWPLSNIVVLKTRGMIILYLTTIVTMIDNNINRVCNGWYRFPYCWPLSNIVVLKTRGFIFFSFNDNSDNDWQYYKLWMQ